MNTHELRLKRAIIQARIDCTAPPTIRDDETATERDAYCAPEECPPTLRCPVYEPVSDRASNWYPVVSQVLAK